MNKQIKSVGLSLCVVVTSLVGYGQQKHYDFNKEVPNNFSTSGTSLSVSNEHVKEGLNGLKWEVKKGTVLKVDKLGISSKETGDINTGSAQFFIYSKEISNDTLVFRFYDKEGILKREGHMLLNYKGWRDYHRSYRFDYNNGKELPGFEFEKMEIVYKPEKNNKKTTLYFDAFTMVGNSTRRLPGMGPHMRLDLAHLPQNEGWEDLLRDFLYTPDLELKPATPQELADAQKIAQLYKRNIPMVTPEKVAVAKKYVDDCAIRRNTDGSITGKGIPDLDQSKTFLLVAQYCSFLAEAAINNGDTDAKDKLLLFTEYLLDQGLSEGGDIYLAITAYDHSRNFMVSFLEGMQLYPPKMKEEVIKMLKWANYYNRIYSTRLVPSTDYMYLWSGYLFELATLAPTLEESVRDLKYLSRYMSLFSDVTPGGNDGMKPDGCVAHHMVPYIGYCHGLRAFADGVYSLKGTSFRITPKAFQNLSKMFKALYLQSSKGVFVSSSASGRNPFLEFPLYETSLEKLIEVGGDIEGKPYDADLASFHNYIYGKNEYPVAKVDYDGFYQFNYAQTGTILKNNWIAVMKGLTNRMWGSEIYANQNRYGRYQSYGSIEVMYNGDREASGLPKTAGNGWDWNVVPGATTIHLPFDKLQPKDIRADEYQKNSFAGALSLGKCGIFAIDFVEDAAGNYEPNNLKFHKSVFANDNILVCLGSGISATNNTSITATNLYQSISEKNPPIYVNNNKITDADYNQVVSTKGKGAWVINGPGTGYYVPEGGGDLTVTKGKHTVPVSTSVTGLPTVTTNFSKAYISHGMAPANSNYRFVLVPGTTATEMENYAKQFAEEKLFKVLSQTDSLHVVKWIPENTTAYAFFEANADVNIGEVKSISGKALLGVTETEDGLKITVNNPDLNSIDDPDAKWRSKWRSTEYKVKLELKGNWKETENPSNSLVSNDKQSTTIEFSLIDGLSTTIKLKRDIDRNQ